MSASALVRQTLQFSRVILFASLCTSIVLVASGCSPLEERRESELEDLRPNDAPETLVGIGEINVKARRREKIFPEQPLSITAFDAEMIQDLDIREVPDIQKYLGCCFGECGPEKERGTQPSP